jgi:hypothetical protein
MSAYTHWRQVSWLNPKSCSALPQLVDRGWPLNGGGGATITMNIVFFEIYEMGL